MENCDVVVLLIVKKEEENTETFDSKIKIFSGKFQKCFGQKNRKIKSNYWNFYYRNLRHTQYCDGNKEEEKIT